MPIAGCLGKETLPDAWRSARFGRTARQSKRPEVRSLHQAGTRVSQVTEFALARRGLQDEGDDLIDLRTRLKILYQAGYEQLART
jgi:hypothetical protein